MDPFASAFYSEEERTELLFPKIMLSKSIQLDTNKAVYLPRMNCAAHFNLQIVSFFFFQRSASVLLLMNLTPIGQNVGS